MGVRGGGERVHKGSGCWKGEGVSGRREREKGQGVFFFLRGLSEFILVLCASFVQSHCSRSRPCRDEDGTSWTCHPDVCEFSGTQAQVRAVPSSEREEGGQSTFENGVVHSPHNRVFGSCLLGNRAVSQRSSLQRPPRRFAGWKPQCRPSGRKTSMRSLC